MRAAAACAGAALLVLLASCATVPVPTGDGAAPAGAPEVRQALLGRNPGLGELRALVEARVSYGGRDASFPGALVLRRDGGFRLDLLDPLDRPLAIVFAEDGRLAQYRPAERLAASLGPFPEGCGGLGPGEWAAAVVADGEPFPAADRVHLSSFLGRRSLEVWRDGRLRQSVRYGGSGAGLRPTKVSWYCDEEPVMRLSFGKWRDDPRWRLPKSFTVEWPRAGLAVKVELREVEAGRAGGGALAPPVDPATRWTVWKIPK